MIRPPTPGTLFAAGAAVCMVFVCISVPILKSLYLFSATYAGNTYTIGLWGYCQSNIGQCSSPKIGYAFDPSILNLNLSSGLVSSITTGLSYLLLLHLVGGILAILTVFFGLLGHRHAYDPKRALYKTCSTFAFITLISLIACVAIDVVLYTQANNRITQIQGAVPSNAGVNVSVQTSLGNAFWLTVAGAALILASAISFILARSFAIRREKTRKNIAHNKEMSGEDYNMRMNALESDIPLQNQSTSGNVNGLPSFPKYEPSYVKLDDKEAIPLEVTSNEHENPRGGLSKLDTDLENIEGVGYGQKRTQSNLSHTPSTSKSYITPTNGQAPDLPYKLPPVQGNVKYSQLEEEVDANDNEGGYYDPHESKNSLIGVTNSSWEPMDYNNEGNSHQRRQTSQYDVPPIQMSTDVPPIQMSTYDATPIQMSTNNVPGHWSLENQSDVYNTTMASNLPPLPEKSDNYRDLEPLPTVNQSQFVGGFGDTHTPSFRPLPQLPIQSTAEPYEHEHNENDHHQSTAQPVYARPPAYPHGSNYNYEFNEYSA